MSRTYTDKRERETAKKKKDVRKDVSRMREAQARDYKVFIERRGC